MLIVLLVVNLLFLFLFPKIYLFIYLFVRSIGNFRNIKYISLLDLLIFIYLGLSLSIMLADRPYYLGKDIGFGEDMFHYYNAFNWIIHNNFFLFIKEFGTIVNLTGSSEPFFWLVVKLISLFTSSEYFIHVLLTFLGLLLIYIAGQIWNKCGLLFIFLYTNTITMFAFQGSAIRSGLAFSFGMIGYAFLLKNKFKIINFLSPFFHFSMIPVPLITYASNTNYKSPKEIIILLLISLISIFPFVFFAFNSIEVGLGAKVAARFSENNVDINSSIQFLVESIFTFIIIFYFFRGKINKSLKNGFIYFFIVALLLLVISPTSFARFYRYGYIFMIYIYSLVFLTSNQYIKILILCFSL